jgi:hypothetical protein
MDLIPSWEANNCSATQDIFQHFMEPEGLLSCSQEIATSPYPEEVTSSQQFPSYFFKTHFNILWHVDPFLGNNRKTIR